MNYSIEYTWDQARKQREHTPIIWKTLLLTASILFLGLGIRYHFPAGVSRLQEALLPTEQAVRDVFYDMTKLADIVEVFCQELLHGA